MRRLGALLVALLAAGVTLAAALAPGGVRDAVEERPYVSYPATGEVSNWGFMLSSYETRLACGNDTRLLFGSSELSPAMAGWQHPVALLKGRHFGLDVMPVGRAYCEDIWQAVEMGAFAGHMGDKTAVLNLSMQWFMVSRDVRGDLAASFSRGA